MQGLGGVLYSRRRKHALMEANVSEQHLIYTTHDDDLGDEALGRSNGGRLGTTGNCVTFSFSSGKKTGFEN
jgi:hypothetical protein